MSISFDLSTDPAEFVKIKDIGVGGFGAVIHLMHKPTGLQLAGKMISPKLLTEETKKSLNHEIELMRQFKSEYTIHYYGTIMYENQMMILMDFCDLGSVRDLMDFRDEVLSEQQIAFILHDTLMALNQFHTEYRMLHRDIKCGNILLNSRCEVKITDFGVSRQFAEDAATLSTTSVLGTPFWMAPEVVRCEKSSFPCDIWSVGATAVEMAEGGPPYCEYPVSKAMIEIGSNGFLGFRNGNYFSENFVDFVFKCMNKDPKSRPTAKELLEHPFIKQTEKLNRFEVFEDLPYTQIDFARLLEMGEEEETLEEEYYQDAPMGYNTPLYAAGDDLGVADSIPIIDTPMDIPLEPVKAPVIKKGGKTITKNVVKRLNKYETFCSKKDACDNPSEFYVSHEEILKRLESKKPAPTPTPTTAPAPAPAPVQSAEEPVKQAGQEQSALEIIKKHPMIVIIALVMVLLGVKKGTILCVLVAAVYFAAKSGLLGGGKTKSE